MAWKVARNGRLMVTSITREQIDMALTEIESVGASAVVVDGCVEAGRVWLYFELGEEYPEYGNDAVRTAYLAGYMDGAAGRFDRDDARPAVNRG